MAKQLELIKQLIDINESIDLELFFAITTWNREGKIHLQGNFTQEKYDLCLSLGFEVTSVYGEHTNFVKNSIEITLSK